MAPEPHIPAWKRLGLKLKYAKEDLPALIQAPIANGKKRKLKNMDDLQENGTTTPNLAKRSKTMASVPALVNVKRKGNGLVDVNGFDDPQSVEEKRSTESLVNRTSKGARSAMMPRLEERKSVTFTPETKHADGESMKDLYQAWVKAQEGGNGDEDLKVQKDVVQDSSPLEDLAPKDEVVTAVGKGKARGKGKQATSEGAIEQNSNVDGSHEAGFSTIKKEKKKKGKKRSRTTLLSASSKIDYAPSTFTSVPDSTVSSIPSSSSSSTSKPTLRPPHTAPFAAALTYLNTFTTSPSTWKFSKNHQTHLLRHILSLSKIPSEYDGALLSYLKGLHSRGAKRELRKSAQEAREADDSWMGAQGHGGGDDEGGDQEDVQGNAEKRKAFKTGWQRHLNSLLLGETKQESSEPPPSSSKDDSNDNDDDNVSAKPQENENKDLTWRIKRRVRAEVILAAIGDKEASPSPESTIHPTTVVRPLSGVKKHVKFRDNGDENTDNNGISSSSANADGNIQTMAVPRLANVQAQAKVTENTRIAVNGTDAQPTQKKKRRKRRSRARTAVVSSDDSSSSSSDSSSSSSDGA